ncbi:MAG: hypothetical protein ACI8XM_002709, partial [Haloarculaceae archaeon]
VLGRPGFPVTGPRYCICRFLLDDDHTVLEYNVDLSRLLILSAITS